VNTFLSKEGSPTILPQEVIRATMEEKHGQIATLQQLETAEADRAPKMLEQLQQAAVVNQNLFESLMETSKRCSLGQITHALYNVGGQYRRNM
jgi:methylmalonyl-CoA mutase